MLEIYHAPGTRGFRVVWLCEELGIPYRIIPVDMAPAYRASPEWRKLNPVGKVPVMSDGDLTMFESGAMVQYVLEHLGIMAGFTDRRYELGGNNADGAACGNVG